MSTITFPDTLQAVTFTWGQVRNDIEYRSVFGVQAVEVSGPLWTVSMTAIPQSEEESGAWRSLILSLRGKTNSLALWHLVRPVPIGTMRGSMVLQNDAQQGDTSLDIVSSGESGKTLLAGDFLGIGSGTTQQVVMVMADATADTDGIIIVTVEPPIRSTIATGSPPAAVVTWNKPCALFRRSDSISGWNYFDGMNVESSVLNFIEDWRT